jgi:hypothetical protein
MVQPLASGTLHTGWTLEGLLAGRGHVDVRTIGEEPLTLRRHDVKAVLPIARATELLAAVPDDWQLVSTGGLVAAPYDTVYFDTPDLRLFRDHRQGRLRRAKIRTRRYADATTVLEIKLKGPAGLTEKVRRTHADHGTLDADDLAWIAATLNERLGRDGPPHLVATAWTRYHRTVLRAPDGTERLTLDAAFATGPATPPAAHATPGTPAAPAAPARDVGPLIVELKSLAPRSRLLPALRRTGSRPLRLSKYAVAINAHHGMHATRWRPALRRLEDTAGRDGRSAVSEGR